MFSFITKYFQAFGTPVSTVILMELLSEFARYGSKYDLTETERKLFEFLLTEASRMVKNFNNFFKDKYGFSLIKNMNDEKRSVMFWFVALFYYVNISESFQYKKYGYSADAIKKLAENFFSIVEAVHGEVDALDIFAHLDTYVGSSWKPLCNHLNTKKLFRQLTTLYERGAVVKKSLIYLNYFFSPTDIIYAGMGALFLMTCILP